MCFQSLLLAELFLARIQLRKVTRLWTCDKILQVILETEGSCSHGNKMEMKENTQTNTHASMHARAR